MSPGDSVVGVSARYAAQIRELLYAHAVRRAAAEEEAARAEVAAERAARLEALRDRLTVEEPVKVEVASLPEREMAEPIRQPAETEKAAPPPPASLVDIQA